MFKKRGLDMSTLHIVALLIVALSLILVVVVGIISYSKAKPALKNIKNTREEINQKVTYFQREGEHLKERVDHLNTRVQGVQKELEVKSLQFDELMDEKGQFSTSLRYLQNHAGDYASGISSNLKDELQEDGPKLAKTFKRAFKKTWGRQKVRYQR